MSPVRDGQVPPASTDADATLCAALDLLKQVRGADLTEASLQSMREIDSESYRIDRERERAKRKASRR